jgi:hypothetical protein
MDAAVAWADVYGNNEVIMVTREVMPKKSLPYVTTSISGIAPGDWDAFRRRADQENKKFRDALSLAVTDLVTAVRRGDSIDWKAIKVAPSRPVRMGVAIREDVRTLGEEFGYRQNVILATAMHRWATRP